MLAAERTLSAWELVAYAMLAVRFVQGFIYWGGGSRRFVVSGDPQDQIAELSHRHAPKHDCPLAPGLIAPPQENLIERTV
jgi:hypothetical protein